MCKRRKALIFAHKRLKDHITEHKSRYLTWISIFLRRTTLGRLAKPLVLVDAFITGYILKPK